MRSWGTVFAVYTAYVTASAAFAWCFSGLAAKTEPVYASRTSLDDDVQPRLAYARKSLEPERLAVKVELPLFSF